MEQASHLNRAEYPRIDWLGLDGLLVRFGDALDEPANRAALALRHAIEREDWPGVEEVTSALVSTYLRFDPLAPDAGVLRAKLEALVASRDWTDEPLPGGRRLWQVPAVFGGDLSPQLEETARLAGLTPDEAVAQIAATRLRVQTIGFAPGQPYLGELPENWAIPRQTELTPRAEVGALVVAIRQMTLFSTATPTGWRQVARTALRPFRPESETPFLLRPGDEVFFVPVARDVFERLRKDGPDGGAVAEALS
jgi:KipI family sensor histidine kinase inhibitor